MRLRRLLFILMLQVACMHTHAQLKVTTLRLGRDNGLAYSFPYVRATNKKVEQKINLHLQNKMLENETIITDTNRIFEKSRFIDTDSSHQFGYTTINYKVGVNNSRVLALAFDVETMGAYAWYSTTYFNFNVQSGVLVRSKDLFTARGISELKKLLIKQRKKLITEWMKELDSMYSKDENEEIGKTFQECNADADVDNFLITGKSILFHKDQCFPHARMEYNIDLDIELNFTDINKYLSENGKKLLFQK